MKNIKIAVIKEEECIGCTKCIQACPVDAIVGAHQQMHTVLAHECIGCELCVAPCPVDCITLVDVNESSYHPDIARRRIKARKTRLANEAQTNAQDYEALLKEIKARS